MRQPSQSSERTFLKMPRRMLLRWLGLYFVLFSLILLMSVVVLLSNATGGPLSGFGSAMLVIVFLAAAINLVIGGLSFLLSFWRRSGRGAATPSHGWPRNRLLRFGYQAALSFVGAVILYGLTGVAGILAIGFVMENAMGWWYALRMPQVKLGDSQQQVEQAVGRGTFRTECDSAYARDASRATDLSRCSQIVLYFQNNGGRWELSYDAAGNLVAKQYVKP